MKTFNFYQKVGSTETFVTNLPTWPTKQFSTASSLVNIKVGTQNLIFRIQDQRFSHYVSTILKKKKTSLLPLPSLSLPSFLIKMLWLKVLNSECLSFLTYLPFMFITALSTITKNWKQPKYLHGEVMDKEDTEHLHVEYYPAL